MIILSLSILTLSPVPLPPVRPPTTTIRRIQPQFSPPPPLPPSDLTSSVHHPQPIINNVATVSNYGSYQTYLPCRQLHLPISHVILLVYLLDKKKKKKHHKKGREKRSQEHRNQVLQNKQWGGAKMSHDSFSLVSVLKNKHIYKHNEKARERN